jgi:hypothetical protein
MLTNFKTRIYWYIGLTLWILFIVPAYEFEGRHADRHNYYVTFWMIAIPALIYLCVRCIRWLKKPVQK